jgi:hypothetical protein
MSAGSSLEIIAEYAGRIPALLAEKYAWLALAGQYVFGAKAKALFARNGERQSPSALLRKRSRWVALLPRQELTSEDFTTEARRWIEQSVR